MGAYRIRSRSYQPLHIGGFVGGLAFVPQGDSEGVKFINFDPLRDGYLTSRLGVIRMHSTPLNSDMVQGLGTVYTNYGGRLVVVKNSVNWYYATEPPDLYLSNTTFNAITAPESPNGYAVRMDSITDTNGVSWAVFVSEGFSNGVIRWDGTTFKQDSVFSNLSGSSTTPVICKYIRTMGPRVYVAGIAGLPYTVRWSNTGDAAVWPSTNEFNVPATFGKVTGLERQVNVLVILCENGVIGLRGDPPAFGTFIISETIGAPAPNTITTYGTSTTFYSKGDFYQVSGGTVKLLSEKVSGHAIVTPNMPLSPTPNMTQTWASSGPRCLAVRMTNNISALGPAAAPQANPDGEYIWIYERMRFDWIGAWVYESPCSLSTPSPSQAIIYALNPHQFAIPGGDGQIYMQSLRTFRSQAGGQLDIPVFTSDYGTSTGVRSIWASKRMTMGNSNMQKQLRKILVGGQGSNIELKLQLFDPEFTQTTYTVTTNKKAPFETEMPQINGSTGISTFSSMRVIVDGRNLNIDGLDLIWRGVRLSSGPKLG